MKYIGTQSTKDVFTKTSIILEQELRSSNTGVRVRAFYEYILLPSSASTSTFILSYFILFYFHGRCPLGRGRHNVEKFCICVYVLDTFIKSQYKWSGQPGWFPE